MRRHPDPWHDVTLPLIRLLPPSLRGAAVRAVGPLAIISAPALRRQRVQAWRFLIWRDGALVGTLDTGAFAGHRRIAKFSGASEAQATARAVAHLYRTRHWAERRLWPELVLHPVAPAFVRDPARPGTVVPLAGRGRQPHGAWRAAAHRTIRHWRKPAPHSDRSHRDAAERS